MRRPREVTPRRTPGLFGAYPGYATHSPAVVGDGFETGDNVLDEVDEGNVVEEVSERVVEVLGDLVCDACGHGLASWSGWIEAVGAVR